MITVCHFVNLITGKSDGVFTHLKMIFLNSDKTRYKHILVFQGDEFLEDKLKDLDIQFYTVSSLLKKNPINAFYQFKKIIIKENPDIIHVHSLKTYAIAGLLNISFRKKFIYNFHGVFINNVYNSLFEKFLYSISHKLINILGAVDLAVVPSNYSKQTLLAETKLFKEIKVYYNGHFTGSNGKLSDKIFNEFLSLKKKYFLVCIIARIERQKRIDKTLQILKKLIDDNQNVFFAFVGDGPLIIQMERYANELGINDYCKFYGFIENASGYMKYFDVCLLTSDWEGMPSIIWEAMANELPILSSDVGGIKEVIEKVKCGIVYDKDNISSAAEILKKLIEAPDELKAMGRNGKQAVETEYNSQKFLNTINDIYVGLNEK